MAEKYKVDARIRRINGLMAWFTKRGWGRSELLTSVGQKTGIDRTTPISPLVFEAKKYIVAPYGSVGWVHNVRKDPHVVLTKARQSQPAVLREVTGQPGTAEVIAAYYDKESFARRFMDVPENPSAPDFEAVSERFPIFVVEPV